MYSFNTFSLDSCFSAMSWLREALESFAEHGLCPLRLLQPRARKRFSKGIVDGDITRGCLRMQGRMIRKEVVVRASLEAVWNDWTTSEGAVTFFAPKANIGLALGGPYELYFDLDAPEGSRGSEGLKILSFLPMEMLSFEWNAPPQYPNVRKGQPTWVVVQLYSLGKNEVRVRLTHMGWGEGDEWDKVFQYFKRAWDIVLGRLEHRFSNGPIDWHNPYSIPQDMSYEIP
jgi:uncharacterized protein YndB with AHSA1/START domain